MEKWSPCRMMLVLIAAGLSGAVMAQSIAPPTIQPQEGGTYFTRMSFHHEGDVHQATNFSRGVVWPINTEVRLVSKTDRRHGRMVLARVDNGDRVTIQNVPRHTDMSIDALAERMLADQPTPIERLPEDVQRAIRAGELRMGMTKEQALMARGYPPTVHTANPMDADTWVYQENRFAQRTIVFENGRIVEGRGLR
ncbi:MAG: outer membrane protein assembly factor BamE [Wenzhouxiangella sp.]|nr:outer membrane protein assembly factor BamE [Wenzhouxiangella sp.]